MARTEYDKLRDYIEFTDKPFCGKDVVEETGMKKSIVYLYLGHMEELGLITRVQMKGNGNYKFYTKETRQHISAQKESEFLKNLWANQRS